MCSLEHIEKERLTGMRNHLLHVDYFFYFFFSPSEFGKTTPVNSSAPLGNEGQELFPRKDFNLSSDKFSGLLRRAVHFTL